MILLTEPVFRCSLMGLYVRIDVSTFLCVTRRSVVRLLNLAELHRGGSVDADAALDAASRTPVLGVLMRRRGDDTVGRRR